jgi:hypothetical protein
LTGFEAVRSAALALALTLVVCAAAAAQDGSRWRLWAQESAMPFHQDRSRPWSEAQEQWHPARPHGMFSSVAACETARHAALEEVRSRYPIAWGAPPIAGRRHSIAFIDRAAGRMFVHVFYCLPGDVTLR